MATPKKIKGASFGEECMDFMKNCEGKKNGTNDNFVRNFYIFGVERNGKSNVIDRLEHLSVMKRILDGEVAAVNRKQKSSKVNYHNEAYENDSSGEEWTPENKPEKKKKPSKKKKIN